MNKMYCASLLIIISPLATAQSGIKLMDTRTIVHLMVDEFEISDIADDNDFSWEIDLSVGGDLNKFLFKTRGDHDAAAPDESEIQFLYNRAVLPFWNLQAGIRRDLDSGPQRDWATLSLEGMAPWFFEVEAELFFAEDNQQGLRVAGEYELLLTQRLKLTPEIEFVSFGRDEPGRLIGSGLSEVNFDIRLRYELKREIAPYIGLSWHRRYGTTRDFARLNGHELDDTAITFGIRAWY